MKKKYNFFACYFSPPHTYCVNMCFNISSCMKHIPVILQINYKLPFSEMGHFFVMKSNTCTLRLTCPVCTDVKYLIFNVPPYPHRDQFCIITLFLNVKLPTLRFVLLVNFLYVFHEKDLNKVSATPNGEGLCYAQYGLSLNNANCFIILLTIHTMIKQYKEFLVFYHHHIIWEYFPYI